jgi:hypothetical protein
MTPEMAHGLDYSGRRALGQALDDQQSVIPEECQIFDHWSHEARASDAKGWEVCAPLNVPQRVELFHRIATLHQTAWDSCPNVSEGHIKALAKSAAFNTTRRWVRACAQILDLLTQHSTSAL